MIDLSIWQNSEQTQDLLKIIFDEIETAKTELTEFGGIMRSVELEREYCHAVGYISALKFVKQVIEESVDKDELK